MKTLAVVFASALLLSMVGTAQQTTETAPGTSTYKPMFEGDKAHSKAEAIALGYMRTVVTAQKLYKKKHGDYAPNLATLVGSGSFTRRMVDTKRGDYTASFRTKGEGYSLSMTPIAYDAEHRAFYVDETGTFRGSENAPATASSPVLE